VKRLSVDPMRCTGCESCVLTCSFEHDDAFSLDRARIRVERDEENGRFSPKVCIQCPERHCVQACPEGALAVDPQSGAIRVDANACSGCRICEKACPYGGIQFAVGVRHPLICDLCGGDPSCVSTCRLPQAICWIDTANEAAGEVT